MILAACGSGARPVAQPLDEPVANAAAPPRDALLVHVGGGEEPERVVALDLDDGRVTELHAEPADRGIDDAAWAGDRVVVSSDRIVVVEPATGRSWTLADRGGYALTVSADGEHVAWDCGDPRSYDDLCVARVDGTEAPRALGVGDGEMLEPLGWRADEIIFQDHQTVFEVARSGGARRKLVEVGNIVTVAPDGSTLIVPDLGVMTVRALEDGAKVGEVQLTEADAWPEIDDCKYAGAAHLVCFREDELVLADWSGNVETLASGVFDSAFLGDPEGGGVAYAEEDGEVVYVVRRGEAQRRFELGARVRALLDWRRSPTPG